MRTAHRRAAAGIAAAGALFAGVAAVPVLAGPPVTPAAIVIAPPACGPALDPAGGAGQYTILVAGSNFDPFTEVLVSFDAGAGGRPESFDATTDGFGSFAVTIQPTLRPAGSHLVRADDFRQREATAVFAVPCPVQVTPPVTTPPTFTPQLRLIPALGPPGFVTEVAGSGFPPGQAVALKWDHGLIAVQHPGTGPDQVTADESGAFAAPLLILRHDSRGPRTLTAAPRGPAVYSNAPSARFLVVPGTLQPENLAVRR
jgi:hypothetical protein